MRTIALAFVVSAAALGATTVDDVTIEALQKAAQADPGAVSHRLELAGALKRNGRFIDAEKILSTAVREFHDAETAHQLQIALADLHFDWARNLESQFAYPQAIEHYGVAFEIDKVERRERAAIDINNLGGDFNSIGEYEKAIGCYEQSLALRHEVKDRAGEGRVLDNLGNAWLNLSQFQRAIDFYEQSLAIRREVHDAPGEVKTLSNLARVYGSLAQPEKSNNYLEQAVAVARTINDPGLEALTLDDLAVAYYNQRQADKALRVLEKALPLARESKEAAIERSILNNLGAVYHSLWQLDKALKADASSLRLAREQHDVRSEGDTLDNLGSLHADMGNYKQAVWYHQKALAVARIIKDGLGEAGTLGNLMTDWRAMRKPQQAIFYGKLAVKRWEQLRTGLDKKSREAFLKSHAGIYRALAALLISQNRLPEARETFDLLKQEEYSEFVRRDASQTEAENKSTPLSHSESEWANRYNEIADRVAAVGASYSALAAKPSLAAPEKEELKKLERESEAAMFAFQKELDGLTREIGKAPDAAARITEIKESEALMQDLRDFGPGCVAICTLIAEDKLHTILITPDVLIAHEFPIRRNDLEQKVRAFGQLLQNSRGNPLPEAQELYRILIGPLETDLAGANAQTLMWSLDGFLRYLPIAALHDGKRFAVERWQNVVFTLASRARLKEVPAANWRGLALGVSKAQTGFDALPEVPDELRGIVREPPLSAGVVPGKIILDEDFTEESFKAALRAKYPLVHIASHFQLAQGDENQSFLLLGDGRRLTLGHINLIPNFFANVELLTLSACQTALGGHGADGTEVESFGVLAQRKGAKAVIATLWPVADISTKLLMQQFYRLREGPPTMSKAEALREAQLALLRGTSESGTKFAHPYFWAPFILIGNWR